MKRILLIGLCLFISFNAYAIDVTNCKPNAFQKGVITKCYPLGSISGEDGLNRGLTFYKNYADQKLDANYALGAGNASFTNTLNSPRFSVTQNSVRINTAFSDVLKYLIANNRTAAQETIVIKFSPSFANGSHVAAILTDTDTKRRLLYFTDTSNKMEFYANSSDSGGSSITNFINANWSANAEMNIAFTMASTGDPNITGYYNGTQNGTIVNDDYTANVWGTYFYLGCDNSGVNQLDGTIRKVAIFNRALTASEVASVTSLLNS